MTISETEVTARNSDPLPLDRRRCSGCQGPALGKIIKVGIPGKPGLHPMIDVAYACVCNPPTCGPQTIEGEVARMRQEMGYKFFSELPRELWEVPTVGASPVESLQEQNERLRAENQIAGDLIRDIALRLESINTSREGIMSQIARFKASHILVRDERLVPERLIRSLAGIISDLELDVGMLDLGPRDAIDRVRAVVSDLVTERRRLRAQVDQLGVDRSDLQRRVIELEKASNWRRQ